MSVCLPTQEKDYLTQKSLFPSSMLLVGTSDSLCASAMLITPMQHWNSTAIDGNKGHCLAVSWKRTNTFPSIPQHRTVTKAFLPTWISCLLHHILHTLGFVTDGPGRAQEQRSSVGTPGARASPPPPQPGAAAQEPPQHPELLPANSQGTGWSPEGWPRSYLHKTTASCEWGVARFSTLAAKIF